MGHICCMGNGSDRCMCCGDSLCILVSLGALGFYEFASQVYRVGCTEHIGTGFRGKACFN